MKSFLSPLFLFAVVTNASIVARVACNADNCARAITGTAGKPALSVRVSDCSSFQRTTVTPDVATVTVQAASIVTVVVPTTTTVYLGTTTQYQVYTSLSPAKRDVYIEVPNVFPRPSALERRAVPTPSVPTYASACSGSVRYASACACYGISSILITLPTPTVTSTTTSTSISTSTQTVTLPLATATTVVCKPDDNYEYFYSSLLFNPNNFYYENNPTGDFQSCCAACYTITGTSCVAYANVGFDQCQLLLTTDGDLPGNQVCSNGIASVESASLGPPYQAGIGPCGHYQAPPSTS